MTHLPALGAYDAWTHVQCGTTKPESSPQWLRANIGILGEALGLELQLEPDVEVPVGEFACDLVAKEERTERIVAVENQLGTRTTTTLANCSPTPPARARKSSCGFRRDFESHIARRLTGSTRIRLRRFLSSRSNWKPFRSTSRPQL
jgi:hypothetical protein